MARYGARHNYRLRASIFVTAVFVLSLALWGRADCVFAADENALDITEDITGDEAGDIAVYASENDGLISHTQAGSQESLPHYLEVILNGQPTDKIAEFTRLGDGRFASRRAELKELSIEPAGDGGDDELIILDDVAAISYRYDEQLQRMNINVEAASLKHNSYLAQGGGAGREPASTTTGGVINYGLYGSLDEGHILSRDVHGAVEGMSASIEARVFGNFGVIQSSGIVGFAGFETQRLDTFWTRSFEDSLVSLTAGDLISGGLGWTRPLRMAGIQLRKNFGIRPDLITKPLPNVSGSAAVPSTVDVYVNNVRAYSKDVPSGPFTIRDLPIVSGAGVTRLVVRDASGRESVTETPFYSSSDLLRGGIWDYSAEIGFPRLSYASGLERYEGSPIASGSLRYGVTDRLTVEAHGEGGLGVVNGGGGVVQQIGLLGTIEAGVGLSHHDGDIGGQVYLGLRGEYKSVHFSARTQRSLGEYTDVAAQAVDYDIGKSSSFSLSSVGPPIALDFVSIGFPVSLTGGSLNFSYLHNERSNGEKFSVANVSYSQKLTRDLSMHSTGFYDLADDGNRGVYLGLTMSLGDNQTISSSFKQDLDGVGFTGSYTKTAAREPGSWGWRLHGSEGERSYAQGDLSYHGSKLYLRGSVVQNDDGVSGSYYADGSVALTSDGIYLAQNIDDGFAVVDAGAPDVEVRLENRVVGHTDSNGKLLVTGLRAYEINKITIDPSSLPINANIGSISAHAIPAFRSGTSVGFNIDSTPNAALVEFKMADGNFVPAGYSVKLASSGEEFVIGYDGQAYISGLGSMNEVAIEMSDVACNASFPFMADADDQVLIRGVVCQ